MFSSTLDESTATLVFRYALPYEPADYTGYQTEFARLIASARTQKQRRVVLLIDMQDGYPQPNAVQRRNIGEAWMKAPEFEAAIAIVTGSVLIRGIITAIEWFFSNSKSQRDTRAFRSANEAVAWLHQQAGIESSKLNAAIDKVRSKRAPMTAHP